MAKLKFTSALRQGRFAAFTAACVAALGLVAPHSAVAGYGDLPDTFTDSTGFATLKNGDSLSKFDAWYKGTSWSDSTAPHSGRKYFVGYGDNGATTRRLSLPKEAATVAAQLATDPDFLTFKGDILVVGTNNSDIAVTAPLANGYSFTIPDLRMLPGSGFYYNAVATPLFGTMTVYGDDAGTPVTFHYRMGSNTRQRFGMAVVGDETSVLQMQCDLWTSSTSGKVYSGFYVLEGDLTGFLGTLKVSDDTHYVGTQIPSDLAHAAWYGYELATTAPNAAVSVGSDGTLYVTAAEGATIRAFSADGTNATIRLDASRLSASSPLLTITDSVSLPHPATIALVTSVTNANGTYTFTSVTATYDATEPKQLLRLGPVAVANGGFGDLSAPNDCIWLADNDGGMTLWKMPWVTHNSVTEGSSYPGVTSETDSNGAYYWQNNLCPATDPDAASKCWHSAYRVQAPAAASASYVFPGKALSLSGEFYSLNGGKGFQCDNLMFRSVTMNLCNANQTIAGRLDDSGLSSYRFWSLKGRLGVLPGYTNTFRAYGTRQVLRFESEVFGGGDFSLESWRDTRTASTTQVGTYEFTALNTNFTGKIAVTMPYSTSNSDGVLVPNWTQKQRLFVSDERNLGGKRGAFAYDALLLEHYSDLVPLCDVTFTDGWNRGIAIGDVGRMRVNDGLTLAILRPLNVNGRLVKEGAGTLALGGTLTFGGAAQSATPTSGSNFLDVTDGYLKPLSVEAVDGLAITFTNSAALLLDATTADADLLRYGLRNVKEATAPITLAPDQATLPVKIDFGALTEPPANKFTVGIATLKSAKAAAILPKIVVSNPKPFQGVAWRCMDKELVDNGDGTSTIRAVYKVGVTVLYVR